MDGIIEIPNLCDFNPETLLCKDANNQADCLNPIQVEKVRKIFSPLYWDDGHLIYPAMQPGSEIMAVSKLYAGTPFSYSEVPPLILLFHY
jgi:feruloyl esterase